MSSERLAASMIVVGACCASMAMLGSCGSAGNAASSTAAKEPDRFADVNTVGYDRNVWQQLLDDHGSIRRVVVYTPKGVEATTESDDAAVVERIRNHAQAMSARVKAGAQVRTWDGVFSDLFANHKAISLQVTPTERGVKIVESSEDPAVVTLLWSHAAGLCEFVREGHVAGARATPRLAAGTMPTAEVAIGGVKHRILLSQPEAAQVERLRAAGVSTVVNFRKPGEHPAYDEAGAVSAGGMGYVNLPYAGAAELTDEVIDGARAALRTADAKGETVAMHCRTGNRVGPAWVAYRVLDRGVDVERAIAEAKSARMVDPALEAKVREYIARRAAAAQPPV
jgi:uncharacterized protein (TIGR01244 family)